MQAQNLRCFPYASDSQNEGLKRLRATALKFHLDLMVVGIRNKSSGKSFRWRQKIDDFKNVLHTTVRGDDLVLLSDGHDVRFLSSAEEMISKYNELVPSRDKFVVCGERKYAHHHVRLLETQWPATDCTPYRFPSTCLIMGPRKLVMEMFDNVEPERELMDKDHCRCGPRPFQPCDQSMLGLWLHRNRSKFVIDYGAALFWSTRGEDKDFMQSHAAAVRMEDGSKRLKNKNTNTLPCVLHVPAPLNSKRR